MPTIVRSTDQVSPRERVSYWKSLTSDAMTQLEVHPAEPKHFSGRMVAAEVGQIRIVDVESSAAIVRHTQRHIASATDAEFMVCLMLQGSSCQRQLGQEDVLHPNDFMVLDSTRPYELVFPETNRMLVLCIPQQELARRVADCDGSVARRVCGDGGLNGTVSTFIRQFWRQCCDTQGVGVIAPRLSDALLDLLSGALIAESDRQGRSCARPIKRRQQVMDFIDNHLCDPALSPSMIADACGMTVRYLHVLFEEGDESVQRFIIRRRLEECARTLEQHAINTRSIAAIALEHGFTSPTHFGRVFRQRFGLSPGEFRAQAGHGAEIGVSANAQRSITRN